MPFPRMTTRRWMVAVAVVALISGLVHRRSAFLEKAARHAATYEEYKRVLDWTPEFKLSREFAVYLATPDPNQPWKVLVPFDEKSWIDPRRVQQYHAMLAAKYRRAARRPWLPVPPDPPEPK